MPMFLNRSLLLVITVALSQVLYHASMVTATPDNSTGTVNCTDPRKNRVIGFELLDGSNNPTTQTVVTTFSTNITIDLNNFANCDLNVRAIVDTPVPADCDINNVRCVRMTLGSTVRRDFNKPFTVYLASGGAPIDLKPVPGPQILQACPYTDPTCSGTRPRCFKVAVNVIPCNKPPTKAPVKPPTKAPVKPPTDAPVKPPTNAPVKPPTNAPVKPPTNAPVKPPTNAPVKPPTNAPVKPPTNAPVKPPTNAPVKAPIPVCPYPEEWVDGCCKNTCKNAYICPANSYRIAHRLCYDNFDDCCCKNGYVKSTTEDKCIPIKPPTKAPVHPPVCRNDYVCPANSYRIANRGCYDNFDDCCCNYGYYKSSWEAKCIKYWWCTW